MKVILKWLKKTKGSSTGIGGAIGVLVAWVLVSYGVLNKPNILIWASVFTVFSAIGGLVDYYQTKIVEKINNEDA
ncbi:hypothetical protein [Methanohalobium sp.]|uniref:hypothetical protein n=1 Tax=Methanohalobium sp. TaxID=2837493 RepID=UPI0025DC321F|nr:hypothetical protein [Methanohalobium sp.]